MCGCPVQRVKIITMKDSVKEIVRILSAENAALQVQELAERTGFTPRYIRQILKESAPENRAEGFSLERSFRRDVRLIIHDSSAFSAAFSGSDASEEMKKEVLYDLLNRNDYVRIDDLADQFFVSRTTMDRIIKAVKEELAGFDLELTARPKYGIRIEGSEKNKRLCYARSLTGEMEDTHSEQKMQKALYEILQENDYEISDLNFNNLVYHLLITVKRVHENQFIMEPIVLNQSYPVQEKIAHELIARISEDFHVDIPQEEVNYVLLHLLGKEVITENSELDENVMELTHQILERIREVKGIDLTGRFDLIVNLALHLQPMLIRLKYHIPQENPLFEQVRREMTMGYDLALVAGEVIREAYGYDMNNQECSYLAMHFSLELSNLESENRSEQKKENRYLLVCSTGRGTARILQYQLVHEFGLDAANIDFGSSVALRDRDLSGYRCIFSTVAIPFETAIPVILIHPSLDTASSGRIRDFLEHEAEKRTGIISEEQIISGVQFRNREEILKDIAERAGQYFASAEALYENLVKREEMSATEIGNECALPHPYDCLPEQTVLLVYILKKPVRWENGKVRFVFFVSTSADDPQRLRIIDGITKTACDRRLLKRLENNPCAEELTACMNS